MKNKDEVLDELLEEEEFWEKPENQFFNTPITANEATKTTKLLLEITSPEGFNVDIDDVAEYINKYVHSAHFMKCDIEIEKLMDEIGEEEALKRSDELYQQKAFSFTLKEM